MEGKAAIAKSKDEYEENKRNSGKGSGESRKKTKKSAQISAAVEKEIERHLAVQQEEERKEAQEKEDVRKYIMSVVQDGEATKAGKKISFSAQVATTEANPPALSSTLKQILGQK